MTKPARRKSSQTVTFDPNTPFGRAFSRMVGVFAQLEAELANEHAPSAAQAALAELVPQSRKRGRVAIGDAVPESVKQIQELYATGLYSQRQLVEEANRRHIPTASGGGKWALRTIQAALASKLEGS